MRIVLPTISELQQQLAIAREHLDVIKMATEELVTELDFDKLIVSIAERARDIIHAETLVVPIIDSENKSYTYRAAVGKNASHILNQTFPNSVGMCGWVLSNKKSLIFGKDLPWLMDEKTNWEEGMESALLVPLMARGEIVGGISGLGKQGGQSFTQEDHDLLVIFANQISIAIDNARTFRELTEEKERTEITLNSIGDAVIATDMDGNIVRVNTIACGLLGWSVDELINKPLSDVFKIHNSDTQETVDDPVSMVIENGEIVGLANHTVLTDRNGREYQIADSAAPIKLEDGEMLGVILVFRDVTEEYNLLADLRSREQRHRRLIEHLGNEYFMFVQNAEGDFIYVSPSVSDCLGYSPKEFIQNYRSYLTENKLNNVIQEKLTQALNGIRPDPYEVEINNAEGSACWLRISETPIVEDNQVIAIDGLVQNVTKQRELELSMRQSQKMEAVGQLSGGIAHDFNNQLGVVMGYLERLHETVGDSPDKIRWVEAATKASQRCVELTQSLLSFSRKKKIAQSIVNLNESILSMQSMLDHSITEIINLKLLLDENLKDAMVDDGEFQDVVLNLVINARDAMPEGGALTIVTENMSLKQGRSYYLNSLPSGNYVSISIIDTGEGMSQQTLERIFEPFFTTKPVGEGTGLGMPMVFGFVNRVNGAVDVHTEEGVGTRIDLHIPQATQKRQIKIKPEKDHELPMGNEKILLVEDESALRELAKEYLLNLGYEVLCAENAFNALDILNSSAEIDLLFSDVVMPGGIDGYQLADKARQLRPTIRVLLATGYASQENTKHSGDDEVADVILYKPYSQSILAQRVRRVLDL